MGMGFLRGLKCCNTVCSVYGTFTAPGLAVLEGWLPSHKHGCQKSQGVMCFGLHICFGVFATLSQFLSEVVLIGIFNRVLAYRRFSDTFEEGC